jgi:hypothetical protein
MAKVGTYMDDHAMLSPIVRSERKIEWFISYRQHFTAASKILDEELNQVPAWS